MNFMFMQHISILYNIYSCKISVFTQTSIYRWGLAWSFLPKEIVDLTTAPVIRKTGKSIVASVKKNDKILITFPAKDKFSRVDDLINFLKTTASELNVMYSLFHFLFIYETWE